MKQPAVSVLIVSYNVKQYLGQALEALGKMQVPGALEVIVVDNNSYDGSVEYIESNYPDVQVIANHDNRGFGKAINQGAQIASGNFFFILNPDTIVQENTVSVFVDYMTQHPEVGLIGPKILNADGSLQLACKRSFPSLKVAIPKLLGLNRIFPRASWANRYNLTYLDPDQVHAVDAISGSAMFIRAELFRELDGFDERFFMFGEDLDLCYRVGQAGYQTHYVPATQIIHYHGESVKSAPYDSINAFYNAMILFVEKHFSVSQSLLMRISIRIGIIFRKSLALASSKRTQVFSIFLDMLAVTTAFIIAIMIKFHDFEPIVLSRGLVPTIYVVAWILVGTVFQLYSRYILSYSRAILASLTGFLFAVAFTFFFKQYAFSRFVILAATLMVVVMLPGWRMVINYLISRGWFRPVKGRQNLLFMRNTIIIGADEEGQRIARKLLKRFDTGLEVIGFCDNGYDNASPLPIPFLGLITDLRDIVTTRNIREVIFSTANFTNEEILRIMEATRDMNLTYRMVPQKQDILLGKALVEEIGDFSFINIEYPLFRKLHVFTKRLFDISSGAILWLLSLPVAGIYSLAGKRKKVEYWGPDGTKFGACILGSDNRFVRGIPLLGKVLSGRMSIVGSPLVETSSPDPSIIFRPGLASLDRIRKTRYTAEDQRLLDHYYVQHQTFTLDLEIIIKSVFGN